MSDMQFEPESPRPAELPPPAPPPAAPPSAPPPARASLWRHPAVIIAVLTLGILGWQWLETRTRLLGVQEELAKRLAQADAVTQESRMLARQSQELTQALQARVGVLEARLAESQGQQVALEGMYQEISRSRDERLLAEIDQAVNIAAQQLQLAGNVQAALIALQGADAQLARADRAQFLPVRKALAQDIERLKNLPLADTAGLALKLDNVLAQLDTLPLAFDRSPRSEPAPTAQVPADAGPLARFGREVWQELKDLVRVERLDASDPGLLVPEQAYFLRENLRLRLLRARLALLQRDGHAFQQDVRQAREWLERYFDGGDRETRAALATLTQVSESDVSFAVPNVNESLAAVRSVRLVPERAADRAADRVGTGQAGR